MSCLVYGIVFSQSGDRGWGHPPPGLLPGVGGAPVRLIEEGGLGAAVSWIEPPDLTPNVARVLAYAKVVEALHANRAVLPMRYGCLFEEEPQVAELLRLHGEEYAAVLRGLDGCVEMGVRVLLPAESPGMVQTRPNPGYSTDDRRPGLNHACDLYAARQGARRDSLPGSVTPAVEPCQSSLPCPPSGPEIEGASGRAYLAVRAARYARDEEVARTLAAVVARLRGTLDGLAVRIEADRGTRVGRGLPSLFFLVKRGAVDAFRRAFQHIERAEESFGETRLLLSGPWPPYNFVSERCGNGKR